MDEIERRRAYYRQAKERQRRAAGSLPVQEHLANRASRRTALEQTSAETGLTISQLYRRIRAGKMVHPADRVRS